jgi:protein arginine kinase activator
MDLCEECKKRKQELRFVEVKDGKRVVRNLCTKCAEKLADALPRAQRGRRKAGTVTGETALTCPNCGLTFEEFRRTAKLGCEVCFEAFSEKLDPLLQDLHASAHYTGKPYAPDDQKTGLVRRIHELKSAMEKAVVDENFEEAARLRDEIKSMEEKLRDL